MQESDIPHFWAAYRLGAFDNVIRDLSPQGFQSAIVDMMGTAQYDWIAEIDRPLGLFLGNPMCAGRVVEVQVDWMPWASARNRLEATAIFLREVARQFKIFIFADAASEPFFERFCRYRMLRSGCRVSNLYGGGRDGRLFYTAP